MLKLLFVGDPHYGKNPSYLAPGEWRKHVTAMLDAALEAAIAKKVHYLVVVGDVFDNNNPHPLDHAEFTDWVFRAKERGVAVIVFPGNHDYGDADYTSLAPYAKMRDTVRVIAKPLTTKLKGVPVKFFPWSPPDVQHKIGDIKDPSPFLIIHHEEAKGAKMDNGWIADGFTPRAKDFLVGGHLHTYQLVGRLGRTLYVGTALPSHWNHKTKGFTLIKAKLVDGKLRVYHEQVPYSPPFKLVELSLAKFKTLPATDKRKTYYRVIVPAGTPIPDDNRIVSRKFIGVSPSQQGLLKDPKGKKRAKELPDPLVWLAMRFPEDRRERAMSILSNIRVSEPEEY